MQLIEKSFPIERSHLPPGRGARIAVILTQLGYGGAEHQTVKLLRCLRDSEWEPTLVICLSEDLEPYGAVIRKLGYRLEVLSRASSFDLRRVMRLRQMLHQERIDLVHAVHFLASGYSWLACLGTHKRRLLPTVRSTLRRQGIIRNCIYRLMFHQCPRILVNSHCGAFSLVKELGVLPERLTLIPNGCDFRELRRASYPSRLRTETGVRPNQPIIGFVGRNAAIKNVPRFLEIVRRLLNLLPEIHAVLIGAGLDASAQKRLAPDLPEDRVHFLGPRVAVSALISDMDVLVVTSNSEGCPNVVLEALGLGVPVVSADVGDVGRMIQQGRTGIAVPAADVDGYVKAIQSFLDGGSLAREMVKEGWPELEATYGIEQVVTRIVCLWHDTLHNFRGSEVRAPVSTETKPQPPEYPIGRQEGFWGRDS